MIEKRLPIRIFHKRKIDNELTEGGGSGNDPKFVLMGNDLQLHASELSENFSEIQDKFVRMKQKRDVPLSIEVKLNKNALAKAHRSNVEKLLADENGSVSSMGFSPDDQWMFSIKSSEHIHQVNQRLKSPVNNARGVSSIECIRPFKPLIEKSADIKIDFKVKLIQYQNNDDNKKVEKIFKKLCESNNITFRQKKYTDSLEIYKLSNVTYDSFQELEGFEGLFSLEPMPLFDSNFDGAHQSQQIKIKNPDPNVKYPVIGLLDSGIEKNEYLKNWVVDSHDVYSKDYLDTSHGTFVAGIIVYGNELLGNDQVYKGCKIFDAAVYPDKNKEGQIHEDELIDNIREVIELYSKDIKIWSLSLGTQREIDNKRFSDFGKTLDYLQDKFNIVIIKSAGNCDNFTKNLPKKRISVSADSVRSIVVGSIAHYKSLHDIVDINYPSPFSRKGPGPAYIIKPDLVDYGGNAGVSQKGTLNTSGVVLFSKGGSLTTAVGTSFSTPRVATSIAMLDHSLKGEFNSLLLKTLLIHKSQHPSDVKMSIDDKIDEMGYGLPPSFNDILHNSPDEITLIMQDVLPIGNYIHILDLPYPDDLVDNNGYYTGDITITIVNHPIIDINHGTEYCQSDLNLTFGTYDEKTKRDLSVSTIKNPTGKKNPGSLLCNSVYSKRKTKGKVNNERILIKNGKFHPTKKYKINLSDLTDGNKSKFLVAPKKWFLKIEGLYRSAAEQKHERTELSQEFCLAITIRDPSGNSKKVYDSVVKQLNHHQFAHENIKIEQKVAVEHKD